MEEKSTKKIYKNRIKSLMDLNDYISDWMERESISIKEKEMAERMLKTIENRINKLEIEYYAYVIKMTGDEDDLRD